MKLFDDQNSPVHTVSDFKGGGGEGGWASPIDTKRTDNIVSNIGYQIWGFYVKSPKMFFSSLILLLSLNLANMVNISFSLNRLLTWRLYICKLKQLHMLRLCLFHLFQIWKKSKYGRCCSFLVPFPLHCELSVNMPNHAANKKILLLFSWDLKSELPK